MSTPDPYIALALQTTCDAVNADQTTEAARVRMAAAIARIRNQVIGSKRFIGQDVRLVVLPEYFLTGFPPRRLDRLARRDRGRLRRCGARPSGLRSAPKSRSTPFLD